MKISDIKLINGNCLVEIEGRFYQSTESGIDVGNTAYNKSDHTIRYGKLTRMPNAFNWDKALWRTDYFPDEGDEVWFDYLDAKDTTEVREDGKLYIILPFKSLILARNSLRGIKVLNGYLLAKKQPIKENNPLDFKQRYYDDIYEIIYAGKANSWYKPEKDKYGNIIREFFDDQSIAEGDIVMTRASGYPLFEDSLHRKFVQDELYYLQRRDIVAKVFEL
jgi:hypothetical protein